MPPVSSLNDVFRFVQLRPPIVDRTAIVLVSITNYVGPLLGERDAVRRRQMAQRFLAEGGGLHRVVTGERLQLEDRFLAALDTARRDAESPTVGDLLDGLGDWRRLVGSNDPNFRGEHEILSDTLGAAFFAPLADPERFRELELLYRLYTLAGLASRDEALLQESLEPLLEKMIEFPEVGIFAPPTDEQGQPLPRVRPAGVADLMVVKRHIQGYEAMELAHVENVMAGETRGRVHRFREQHEDTDIFERETTVEKEEELATEERFELNREAERTIKDDEKFGFGLNVSASYGSVVQVSSNVDYERSRAVEESTRNATTYAQDVTSRSLERVKERVRTQRTRRVLREWQEENEHRFENTAEKGGGREHIVGLYQFVDKVYEAQVFNYGRREMFDFMIPEPASFLLHLDAVEAGERVDEAPSKVPQLAAQPARLYWPPVRPPDPDNDVSELVSRYGAEGVKPPPPRWQSVSERYQAGLDTDEGGREGRQSFTMAFDIPEGYRPRLVEISVAMMTDDNPDVGLGYAIAGQREDWDPLAGWIGHETPGLLVENIGDGNELLVGTHTVSLALPRENPRSTSDGLKRALIGSSTVLAKKEGQADAAGGQAGDAPNFRVGSGNFQIGFLAYESSNHSIIVTVRCERSEESLRVWQLETFEKINDAYRERLTEYRSDLALYKDEVRAADREAKSTSASSLREPPSRSRRVILTELTKHCASLLLRESFPQRDSIIQPDRDSYPHIDFARNAQNGSLIRFIQQAFEWEHLQFALYPYFWGRLDMWPERFAASSPDEEFADFLKAGAARAVVPVRPGFEQAVNWYLATGELWGGAGDPPRIGSPLYVPIVQELRERDGVDDAIPVGEPWEVRVPTDLLLLREQRSLPEWERERPAWEWTPVDDGLPTDDGGQNGEATRRLREGLPA